MGGAKIMAGRRQLRKSVEKSTAPTTSNKTNKNNHDDEADL
jgi:hypothetical protein